MAKIIGDLDDLPDPPTALARAGGWTFVVCGVLLAAWVIAVLVMLGAMSETLFIALAVPAAATIPIVAFLGGLILGHNRK